MYIHTVIYMFIVSLYKKHLNKIIFAMSLKTECKAKFLASKECVMKIRYEK